MDNIKDLNARIKQLETLNLDLLTNPRDEYHTMDELYYYRMLYNAHAVRGWLDRGLLVVKSVRHSDGEAIFDGTWFIVTAQLPTGQVSNHYKLDDWYLFRCPIVNIAPVWDGHTPEIAARRLREDLEALSKVAPPR